MRKLLALALLIVGLGSGLPATTLSGSFVNGGAVGQTGTLYLQLSQQSSQLSTGGCGGPSVVVPTVSVAIVVTAGTVTSTTIIGNDCLQPAQTYYIATFKDQLGNTIFQQNWQITGSTINAGNILPIIVPQGTLSIGTGYITNLFVSGACTLDGAPCPTGNGSGKTVFTNDIAPAASPFTEGPFSYTTLRTGWYEVRLYSAIVSTSGGANILSFHWFDENNNQQGCSSTENTSGAGTADWNSDVCKFWALVGTVITYQLQTTGGETASFHAMGFQIP